MIILASTSDSIQITCSGTTDVDIHASYVDLASGAVTPGRKNTNVTGTSATDIVAAPGASTYRSVKTIAASNTHANSVDVTVTHLDGTTTVELTKVTLPSGSALHYDQHAGWRVLDERGRVRSRSALGLVQTSGTDMNVVVLAADDTNNNGTPNTLEPVASFSVNYDPQVSGTWFFRIVIHYTAAATTTGSRWTVNGNGYDSPFTYRSTYSLTTTSITINEGLTGADVPASSNATSAATAANIAIIEGFINTIGNGFQLEPLSVNFASEVAGSAIVARAGSLIHIYQTV